MDTTLFYVLLSLITLLITVGGGYLVNFLRQKIGTDQLTKYYEMSKQIVMAIKQLNSELPWEYKKELAISKLSELANNKIISEQANTLIESDVYEVKKLLQKNNITK